MKENTKQKQKSIRYSTNTISLKNKNKTRANISQRKKVKRMNSKGRLNGQSS